MRGSWMYRALAPVLLAAGLSACAAGVQPGIVGTSPAPQSASAGPYYGQGPAPQGYPNGGQGGVYNAGGYNGGGYNGGGYNGGGYSGGQGGYMPVSAQPGDGGRVVSINDVSMGGGGMNGTAIGGILGSLGGVAIGVGTGGGWAGGLLGGLIGAMGGAVAGSVIDQHRGGGGRGIEVTVQRDDGSQVRIAQRDDGDIQLGDRVQIVQGRNGAARAVPDHSHTNDYPPPQMSPPTQSQYSPSGQNGGQYGGQYGGQPQYNPQPPQYGDRQPYAPPMQSQHTPYGGQYGGQQQYNPPPQQDYRQSQSQYGQQPPDYGSSGQSQGPVYPQNNPRYGTLQ